MLCLGFLVVFHCAQPTPPVSDTARFCQIAQPFRWSSRDSEETKRQAKSWNAAGSKVCGWKPAVKKPVDGK